MPGRRKLENLDHEKMALRMKIQEQRSLEKCKQTLDLEKTYRLKLLNLDNRIVRVNFKKLKESVSGIKSYLSADEISELKQLEAQGKLKTYSTALNLSSALKIAGAAKRLKLQTQSMRPLSAHPRIIAPTSEDEKNSNSTTPRQETKSPNLRRSNSVTGAFIDAPEANFSKRRNSVEGTIGLRPLSATNTRNDNAKANKVNRPITSLTDPKGMSQRSSYLQTPKTPHHTHSPFTSHSTTEKKSKNGPTPRENRSAFIFDENIDSNLGDDLYEEKRTERILEEEIRFDALNDRKKDFMVRLNEYLIANPAPVWDDMSNVQLPDSAEIPSEDDDVAEESEEVTVKKPKRRLLPGRSRLSLTNSFTNEEVYKQKMVGLWTDLNKCRYLRVPDDRIDVSGVDTLAKSQIKLFQMLQKRESVVS